MGASTRVVLTTVLCLLLLCNTSRSANLTREHVLPRAQGEILLDGYLDDSIWQDALKIETFYEISPGDNTPPVVRTTGYMTYDSRFLYVGFHCEDPHPEEIRAVYSDRDSVVGDQDFVQFDLDTRNDEKGSFIFRVNPRSVLSDAIFSEATGLDDFSPDFSFEAEGRIVQDGWNAEFKIPLTTLRYSSVPDQIWGITLYRNYPREFRRQMTSLPIPRGANCWLCYNNKLSHIKDLPPSRYFLVVPFATAQNETMPSDAGSSPRNWDGGIDMKWIPRNDLTLDGTWNPDFAQVEADVPQIAVNTQFALFYPEKRSFFLEAADLLITPLQVVYTRSITSPAWGARGTGRAGNASCTLLVTEDEGGGTQIIPGPVSSRIVPQIGNSVAAVGRLRYAFGDSFAGIVFTDREGENSFNRLLGPDVQWRPNETNQLTAQWLISNSRFGNEFRATDSALSLNWQYSAPSRFVQAGYQRFGHDFRADNGFIPQVGVHHASTSLGYRFYPEGWLVYIQPGFTWDSVIEIGDETVSRSTYPSLFLQGKWNSAATLEAHIRERSRTDSNLIDYNYFAYDFTIRPARLVSLVEVKGNLGQEVDFENERKGQGGSLAVITTLRPGIHLTTDLQAERRWLNIDGRRLFTADVAQAKATYNFSPRMFVRAIGQYTRTRREPDLYREPVDPDEGFLSGSLLYGYRFNWQTVLYIGYSHERFLEEGRRYVDHGSNVFVKIAYAFEP